MVPLASFPDPEVKTVHPFPVIRLMQLPGVDEAAMTSI
jgi:hypothetical protein